MQHNLTQPSADSSDEDAFFDVIRIYSKLPRIRKQHGLFKTFTPPTPVSPLKFRSREQPISLLDPSSHPEIPKRDKALNRATPSSPLASRSQPPFLLITSSPDSYSSTRAPTPPHPEEQQQQCDEEQEVLDGCQDDTGGKQNSYAVSLDDDAVTFPRVCAIIAVTDEDDNHPGFTTDANSDEIRKEQKRKNVVRQLRDEGDETLANKVGFHIASSSILPYHIFTLQLENHILPFCVVERSTRSVESPHVIPLSKLLESPGVMPEAMLDIEKDKDVLEAMASGDDAFVLIFVR
jgi:hypothetical protein